MNKPWLAIIFFTLWGLFQMYAVVAILRGRRNRPKSLPVEAYNALVWPDLVFIPIYLLSAALLWTGSRLAYVLAAIAARGVAYMMVYLPALSGLEGRENLTPDPLFLR